VKISDVALSREGPNAVMFRSTSPVVFWRLNGKRSSTCTKTGRIIHAVCLNWGGFRHGFIQNTYVIQRRTFFEFLSETNFPYDASQHLPLWTMAVRCVEHKGLSLVLGNCYRQHKTLRAQCWMTSGLLFCPVVKKWVRRTECMPPLRQISAQTRLARRWLNNCSSFAVF
jgi:hypothetical protein